MDDFAMIEVPLLHEAARLLQERSAFDNSMARHTMAQYDEAHSVYDPGIVEMVRKSILSDVARYQHESARASRAVRKLMGVE